jgi:putative phosphoribosyl transferase
MLFREEDEDLDILPFADRTDAGLMLAGKLAAYSRRGDAIVFGLLRGGVSVAAAVASALKLPLDAFVVTKISTPWERELAMGAVAEGGVQVLDLSLVQLLGISEQEMQEAVAAARNDLESHVGEYRAGHPSLELQGKTAILVDDGIATGCSILAAIAANRRQGAARVVVAVPVAPAAGCSAIRMEADEFVSVAEPVAFLSVSQWYRDFAQVSDQEVQRLLRRAERSTARAA